MINSLDVLYFVLAFCAIWVTVMVAWFVFSVTSIIRGLKQAIEHLSVISDLLEKGVHMVSSAFGSKVAEKAFDAMSNIGRRKKGEDEE
ncbi:MAG: hypothetical protein O3B64_00625 [bacterium]|nr:hypothetical protein [bacterium]